MPVNPSVEPHPRLAQSFRPAGIKSLAEIDRAEDTYPEQCVELIGIVSPESQGASVDKDYETHMFSLAAWRYPGGPLVDLKLMVFRAVPKDADFWDDFPEYTVHRMSVLLSKDQKRAVFERELPLGQPDQELIAFAAELKKPVVVPTKTFGDLVLDRGIGWFNGKAKWNGTTVNVRFKTDDRKALESALHTGEALWSDQPGWKKKVDDFAVAKLLELKNDAWLDEREKPLTAEQFIRRMKLKSISISPDGDFEFWHEDGDLFWGHSIEIDGNLKEGLKRADIPG